MIGCFILAAALIGGLVWFGQAYEDAKRAGYVSREYIYGPEQEKTPNAVTSDVNQ